MPEAGVVPLQFVFGSRASRVSGRHISSRTPESDVAVIRESPLNVTRHPPDFQFADRWPSSRTQSSRPPNRETTFHDSGASGASGLLHSTHAHSADAEDASMNTASSATNIVTRKSLRFSTGTHVARLEILQQHTQILGVGTAPVASCFFIAILMLVGDGGRKDFHDIRLRR